MALIAVSVVVRCGDDDDDDEEDDATRTTLTSSAHAAEIPGLPERLPDDTEDWIIAKEP